MWIVLANEKNWMLNVWHTIILWDLWITFGIYIQLDLSVATRYLWSLQICRLRHYGRNGSVFTYPFWRNWRSIGTAFNRQCCNNKGSWNASQRVNMVFKWLFLYKQYRDKLRLKVSRTLSADSKEAFCRFWNKVGIGTAAFFQ